MLRRQLDDARTYQIVDKHIMERRRSRAEDLTEALVKEELQTRLL